MIRKRPYASLRDWRNEHRLSQRDAAKRLGLSQASYSRFENRRAAPRPRRAKSISQLTGVPLESILGIAS
jgi:transcriptional regulator with XRE-family HTH domain